MRMLFPLLIFFALASNTFLGAEPLRVEIALSNWKFKAYITQTAAHEVNYPTTDWESISLPHSWVTETRLRKQVYEDAWYRCNINPGNQIKNKSIYLFFARVSINATVYVNGKLAGSHKGPMTSFIFDVTPFIQSGRENIIAVKVDNSQDPQSMPANYFGGILGDVKLLFTSEIHIDPMFYGSSGVLVIPKKTGPDKADFKVMTRIRNSSEKRQTIQVINTLIKNNREILRKETSAEIDGGLTEETEISFSIDNPDLWSPEDPSLYELKAEILVDGRLKDELTLVTGFRDARITSDDIWLNGSPVKLYGVNYTHPSNEEEGAAISNRSIRADLDDIKYEIGANAVRFAHWPFPRAAYEYADSIGLIVMSENGYAWYEDIEIGHEGDRLTREMIYQNFNHPSILFWSSGNENPHPGYYHYARTIRETDSSRIIVCVDDKNDFITAGKLNIPFEHHDAVFQNKYPGWYEGSPWNFAEFTNVLHLIGETGAGSLRTNHQPYRSTDFEREKFEPEEWAQIVCEAIFQTTFINFPEQVDALFIWHYRDVFSGKYKGYNTKGLLAAGDFRKDLYFLYQSFLNAEREVLQIVGKHWYVRNNENDIKVYSNAGEVELKVNGKTLGNKLNGTYRHIMYNNELVNNVFYWEDALRPGENKIIAQDNRGNEQQCTIYLTDPDYHIGTTGKPLIHDLKTLNSLNRALLLEMPPMEQYPVYLNEGDSRVTGHDADNSFMDIPALLKSCSMIITRRQSDPLLNSGISFTVSGEGDIKIYIMISGNELHESVLKEGFESSGINGTWRDNFNNPVSWTLFEKLVPAGDNIIIDPGIVDYSVFILKI